MGSSFVFSCPMVHAGVIRRSDDEFSEVTWIGISARVWKDMVPSDLLETFKNPLSDSYLLTLSVRKTCK